jgi:glutamate-1-semialdehyde aminotransferase
MSAAAAVGGSTSATEAIRGSATVAQADTSSPSDTAAAMGTASSAAMQRADELLRQMTIEEKAMQLSCIVPIAVLGADGPMRNQLDALLG